MINNEMIDKELLPLLPGIGERIKKFREYRGLTTQKMSQLMNTPENTISQIETGEIPIHMPILVNYCQYLGANINWLLTGKESMAKENLTTFNLNKILNMKPNQQI